MSKVDKVLAELTLTLNTEEIDEVLSDMGVNTKDENGEYRPFYDVLADIIFAFNKEED